MRDAAHAVRGRVPPLSVAVAGGIVVVDQLTKWWAVESLDTRERYEARVVGPREAAVFALTGAAAVHGRAA